MQRTLAIIEREMRRFRRSPMLLVISMLFPIVQLVVLGYAFGGNVKHLKVAVVDQDHGLPAVKIRELASAVSAGNQVFDILDYSDPGAALTDLRNGRVNGVLTIPPDYSRRTLSRNQPKVALIEDNTDSFVSATLASTMGQMVSVDESTRRRRASGCRANRRSTSSRSIRSCRTCSTCCQARSRCRFS